MHWQSFLAAIAALYVTMSVGWSVGVQRVSTVAKMFKIVHKSYNGMFIVDYEAYIEIIYARNLLHGLWNITWYNIFIYHIMHIIDSIGWDA